MRAYALALVAISMLAACDSERIPADFEAQINPSRTWYHTGQTVLLLGVVTDGLGEAIDDVEVIWTVEPAGAATLDAPLMAPTNASFTLNTEGSASFTGCVVPREEDVAPFLCDTLRIRIDDGMPALEVETPTPGAEIEGGDGITVRGSVADRSMVNVYLNGTPAVVDEMGRFEGTVEGYFGVNHLVVSATDGLTDVSDVEMDVLWAPSFTPALGPDGTPLVQLDDGLSVWLGQDFFDDGAPVDTTARPVTTNDMADVLQLVIASLDVGSFIPDPVVDNPGTFTLRVTDAAITEAQVEIDVTEEGADLFVRLGRVSANTSGVLMIEGTSLPLTGSVSGSAVAYAPLTIRKDGPDAELVVELGTLVVGLESVQGEFVSSETAAVFRLAEGLFRTTIEDALVAALQDTLAGSVPGILRDAFGSIDTALAGQSIELNSAPLPPVRIEIDGRMTQLRSSFRRDLTAVLRTDISTTTPSVHPDSLGVPRLTTLRALPFVNEGSLQLGIRLAMLNGLLHSLWASGLLDIDATSILPDGISGLVSEARIVGRMQPLLRPPRADETDTLVLSLGQLELELRFMGEPVRFAMSLDAGVSITLTASRIAVDVAEVPTLHIWTLQAPSNPRLLSADTIETLLLDLWPSLRESVVGGLAIDLPLPAIGDLGGLAPDLAGLTLSLDMTDALRTRRGVLVMRAEMTGELP